METNIDIKVLIENITTQLTAFYNGANWVTGNFSTRVLSLQPDEALKKIPGHSHSVAELTAHMSAWRIFVVQKLTGNDNYDINNKSSDWPVPESWEAICEQFEAVHQNLLSAITNFPSGNWNANVPGRNYSFIYLINGILQHDYYHFGQIGSLLAGIKKI